MAQWWERLLGSNPGLMPYVGWVCCWFSSEGQFLGPEKFPGPECHNKYLKPELVFFSQNFNTNNVNFHAKLNAYTLFFFLRYISLKWLSEPDKLSGLSRNRPLLRVFFARFSGFPPSKTQTFLNSSSPWKQLMTSHLVICHSIRLFIYHFYFI